MGNLQGATCLTTKKEKDSVFAYVQDPNPSAKKMTISGHKTREHLYVFLQKDPWGQIRPRQMF